jgi:hypothetical protein
VLGQVPKASVVVYKGQLAGLEDDWEDSLHTPKAFLEAHGRIPGMQARARSGSRCRSASNTRRPSTCSRSRRSRKGFRRAIQAAMGRTSSRRRRSASTTRAARRSSRSTKRRRGHVAFRRRLRGRHPAGGVICEDLIDKVYDYEGETAVMSRSSRRRPCRSTCADNPEAYSTYGDHLVTVTTAPSSDSEYDAVEKFIDGMIGTSARSRRSAGRRSRPTSCPVDQDAEPRRAGRGARGRDHAAAVPAAGEDGKPLDPALVAAQQQIQQLQQKLQPRTNEIAAEDHSSRR